MLVGDAAPRSNRRSWARAGAILGVCGLTALLLLATTSAQAAAAPAAAYVQGAAGSVGSRVTSQTLSLSQAVPAGDLLVGWFAQYDAPGQVVVSDNVNGTWTRSVSEPWSSGRGDISLWFVPHSEAAPSGLTITVTATAPTYLQSTAAEYSGVGSMTPLDQAVVASSSSTAVDAGPTNPVPAGELVYSALTTGGSPGRVTPGQSAGQPFTARASTSSGSVYEQDITGSAAGAQHGTAQLASSTDWYAVTATFATGTSPPPTPGTATFDQGVAVSTGSRTLSTSAALSGPVHGGDLLVGWFAQFNGPGDVTVSDNVNGTWTRAPAALTFQSDTGDIALYYLANAKASPSGVTLTVAASTPAFFEGSVAEYSGMALAGPLDQVVSARGVGTNVSTGGTPPVASGELVFSAIVTGSSPGGVTPGSTNGAPYTARATTAGGSSFAQDVLSASPGPQAGAATLGTSADWYAVAAAFRVFPTNDTSPPGPPSGLRVLSNGANRVAVTWSAGSGDLTGYSVYRNGVAIASTGVGQTTYLDTSVTGGATETYTVDAFDGANLHSAQTVPVTVVTPVSSPSFIEGTAASPGGRALSLTLTLSAPVAAGDLLIGWFGQYAVPGQVAVSDNINGRWTRGVSEPFTSGTGDIALEYVPHSLAAPKGVTITVSASAPAYLQEAVAVYRGLAQVAPLATALVGHGSTVNVSLGPSSPVPAGDLVVAGTLTAGQPGSITPGTSLGVPYVVDVANGSASASIEDILTSAAGAQSASSTLGAASTSYTVLAVLRPAGS